VDLVLFVSFERFWGLTCDFWGKFGGGIFILQKMQGIRAFLPIGAEQVADKSDVGRRGTVTKVYARELLIAYPTSE
jgi:hypothetical protein